MRRKIPPFAAVRAFEAVARHQHLGLAADELCVTHSALSQQIKHLEAWFGREMFIRQRGRLILNPSCQELVVAYSMALDVLQDATEEYERLDDSDFIKIVSDPAFFATCLIGGAREFAEALEGANVDIITLHDLGERFPPDADIVVHYRRPEGWEDSHSEKLMDLHGFPACAPSLLEGRRRPEVPDDLGEFLLLHGADRSTWYNWLRQHGAMSLIGSRGVFFNDYSLTIRAALQGDGVLIADPVTCREELASGALVRLFDETVYCVRYSAFCPRNRYTVPRVRAVFDSICSLAAQLNP